MPTCASRSACEVRGAAWHRAGGGVAAKGPSRCARRMDLADERAVSEVVGYLLVFGILSVILVLSMYAFSLIQARAEESVVEVEGESVAQRVASAVVNAALFVEQNYNASRAASLAPKYTQPLDLPADLQGHAYTLALVSGEVHLVVPQYGMTVTAPLFSANAPANVDFCAGTVDAGPILVSFDRTVSSCIQLLED